MTNLGNDSPDKRNNIGRCANVLDHLFMEITPYRADSRKSIPIGTVNLEFWDAKKAKRYASLLAQHLRSHFAVLGVQEVSPEGLAQLAEAMGYLFYSAAPNERGQACGILWDPQRFDAMDCFAVHDVLGVDGVQQLRSSAVVELRCRLWNESFRVVSDHFKSLIGGQRFTQIVRFHQTLKLLHRLKTSRSGGPSPPTIALGDWNCALDELVNGTARDVEPFLFFGWRLINAKDHRPTQARGDRLDGAFVKDWSDSYYFGGYRVIPIFDDLPELTDHAAVIFEIRKKSRLILSRAA